TTLITFCMYNKHSTTENQTLSLHDALPILEEGQKAEWGEGEALAFASILKDGIPIRITGQDSERGTFAHRHLVLYDTETGEKYRSEEHTSELQSRFDLVCRLLLEKKK